MKILTLKEETNSCLMEERRGVPLLPRHSLVISGVWTLLFSLALHPELHFFSGLIFALAVFQGCDL